MSSLINWEVARGRAEEVREAGLRSGPRASGLRGGGLQEQLVLAARALQLGEHLLRPLQRRPRCD
jgi:hypothetical protein